MNIAINLHTFKYCAFGKHIRYSLCAINSKYLKNVLINERRPYCDLAKRKLQNGAVFRPISKCVITTRNVSSVHKSVFDVNTNIKSDVVLYKNDSWYFTVVGYLALIQFSVWAYFAYHFVNFINNYLPEGDVYIFGLIPLHEKRWQIAIPSTFVLTGLLIGASMSLFSYKNIFQIILRKGGKSVFIETFGIFRFKVKGNFDLNQLSCSRSRQSTQGYLGIKHKGARFNLLVDREGEFYDPILFDMTAGMFRDLRLQPKK